MALSDLLYVAFGIGDRDELPRLTPAALDRLLEAGGGDGAAVLYKHSPRCIVCRRAIGEVEALARSRPELPVYVLDVLEQRGLSDRVARKLGVSHESPQVLVLRGGRATWSASHGGVDERAIERAIEEAIGR